MDNNSSYWNDLLPQNSLFTLIDFQKSFSNLMKKDIYKDARNNILMMIKMFNKLNIPMIGTEHYRKGLGATDEHIMDLWNNNPMYDKITFSCCGCNEYSSTLQQQTKSQNHPKSTIILAGLETHICVLQTALDLLSQQYKVVVPMDAVISSTTLKWKNGLDLMERAGAHIVNTETLLFYFLKRADTPDFKFYVKLLKENNSN
ncbi:MAG: isochorismatase family protein [Oligoflexia bacterium]|nr:isochorismatase family protein [Oligoflexia bacterium]